MDDEVSARQDSCSGRRRATALSMGVMTYRPVHESNLSAIVAFVQSERELFNIFPAATGGDRIPRIRFRLDITGEGGA